MNVCEPILEAYAIYDTYACRKGKGNRKALSRAQHFARKFDWYLKLDIQKYFDTIDHNILLRLLSRKFKDQELLHLFEKLFDTYHIRSGRGMPIGNLISQHLANFYLGTFDHWIKEALRVQGFLRYMDDFILFGPDRAFLKTALKRVRAYLADELALSLNHNIQLNRCTRGIPFIGYRVFASHIRLSPRSRKRFVHKFRIYEKMWHDGRWPTDQLVSPYRTADRIYPGRPYHEFAPSSHKTIWGFVLKHEPCPSRRRVEQHRRELPDGQPQQERPGQPERQYRVPACLPYSSHGPGGCRPADPDGIPYPVLTGENRSTPCRC